MIAPRELASGYKPTWCPGCGNYGILNALKAALAQSGLEPRRTVLVSGIGCSSKLPQYIRTYAFEGLHGRELAVATGVKLANHRLAVIALAGDGDGYGLGTGHFIHTMRRNLNLTYIVHNNQIYGLTTGQASPTSDKGFISKSTPQGVLEIPFNPLALALAAGATFIARGFVLELKHLTALFSQAIAHPGFALVDVFQPCVTWNHLNTYDYYRDKVYKLEEDGHDPADRQAAWRKSQECGDRVPIGLFYKEIRPSYEDELPQLRPEPLAEHSLQDIDITPLLDACC